MFAGYEYIGRCRHHATTWASTNFWLHC